MKPMGKPPPRSKETDKILRGVYAKRYAYKAENGAENGMGTAYEYPSCRICGEYYEPKKQEYAFLSDKGSLHLYCRSCLEEATLIRDVEEARRFLKL